MHLVKHRTPTAGEQQQIAGRQLRFRLAKLVKTSEQMLGFAAEKDWARVEELESVRREDLGALGDIGDTHDYSPEVAEVYASVLAINARISSLLESERHELLGSFQDARSRAKAASYYKSM